MSTQHDLAIEHYRDGSANPAWIREMLAMETEPEVPAEPVELQEAA